MGELKAEFENGQLRGFVRIWPGIVGGFFVSSAVLGVSTAVNPDGKTTYDPSELVTVDFSPQDGMLCTGLSPGGSDEVIASTISCERNEP